MNDILSFITFVDDLTDDVFDYCIDEVSAKYFFTHGGCYEFACVIKEFIPSATIMINKELNHVALCIGGYLYDACGLVDNKEDFLPMTEEDYKYVERQYYGREFKFEGKRVRDALIGELNVVSGTYLKELVQKINEELENPKDTIKLVNTIKE